MTFSIKKRMKLLVYQHRNPLRSDNYPLMRASRNKLAGKLHAFAWDMLFRKATDQLVYRFFPDFLDWLFQGRNRCIQVSESFRIIEGNKGHLFR